MIKSLVSTLTPISTLLLVTLILCFWAVLLNQLLPGLPTLKTTLSLKYSLPLLSITPLTTSFSTIKSAISHLKSISILGFNSSYIDSKIFKLTSVPKCLTSLLKSFNPTANPFFSISKTSFVLGSVKLCGAPWAKLISSTYLINEITSSFEIQSLIHPPNSLVILNFPSLKAPHPPNPLVIEHAG